MTASSVSGAPERETSFFNGDTTTVSPTKVVTKSGVPIGASVPAAFTSTVSTPVAVAVPSETWKFTCLCPSSEETLWKVTKPSGVNLTVSPLVGVAAVS